MTWLVYVTFRGKDWGALCGLRSPKGVDQPLLVAQVTAIPEALVETEVWLDGRRGNLLDGRGSVPRTPAVNSSTAGWSEIPGARSGPLAKPTSVLRPGPVPLTSQLRQPSVDPAHGPGPEKDPLGYHAAAGNPSWAATPPHLSRSGSQTGVTGSEPRGSAVPCLLPPNLRILRAPRARGG